MSKTSAEIPRLPFGIIQNWPRLFGQTTCVVLPPNAAQANLAYSNVRAPRYLADRMRHIDDLTLECVELPDQRKHRGPHLEDRQLFAADQWPRLRDATADLSWLLSRGYASPSALKMVGDRYGLEARQRVAVARCACSDDALVNRRQQELQTTQLEGKELWIDGYNVLTSIEAALSGAVILHARDGCYRDMASMHGTFHTVEETIPAARIVGEVIAKWRLSHCHWLLDQPVSNSGRLRALLQEIAAGQSWNWAIELALSPDTVLCQSAGAVATADSHILDRALHWVNLARLVIDRRIPEAWIIDLSSV